MDVCSIAQKYHNGASPHAFNSMHAAACRPMVKIYTRVDKGDFGAKDSVERQMYGLEFPKANTFLAKLHQTPPRTFTIHD